MRSAQGLAVAKDIALFVVGLSGIVYQLLTARVDLALLGVFVAMTGVPGLTNLISLLRGLGTESPPSSRQVQRSESDSQ